MSAATRLADHLERTITGPMWHGSALDELLNGVSAGEAAAHPVAGAHSIWELVLHITTWSDVARARAAGEQATHVPDDVDWPTPAAATEENWANAVTAMRASYSALARATAALSDDALAAPVRGGKPPHSVETLLRGVIEHGTYHGGQIAILKRATKS